MPWPPGLLCPGLRRPGTEEMVGSVGPETSDLAGDAGGDLLVTLTIRELHPGPDECEDWFPLKYQELLPGLLGLLHHELGSFIRSYFESLDSRSCYRLDRQEYW